MKNSFIEKVQTLNIKFFCVKNFDEEQKLEKEKAELKCDIAIAAYNGLISEKDVKGMFSLIIF